MAKLDRATVIAEALDLLDEVGLDAVSTRPLAQRLGVQQPSLFWHFRSKEDLLAAMAQAAMAPQTAAPLPQPSDDWREWFLENHRGFRRTLLIRRDGARLHAGLVPGDGDLGRIGHKIAFLVQAGVPESDAMMAMLAASRFTVGCVLEQQADDHRAAELATADVPFIDHESAFEAGLALILGGLIARISTTES